MYNNLQYFYKKYYKIIECTTKYILFEPGLNPTKYRDTPLNPFCY